MRIVVGADHNGFGLEPSVVSLFEADGHDAAPIVRAFLATDFEGGCQGRRVARIADIERRSE